MMPRRVVVAGAGRPLGMALVHAALDRGDRVLAGARRPAAVPALADLAVEVGDRLIVAPFEAANAASCDALADAARAHLGAVDLVIDAAVAGSGDGPMGDTEARRTFDGTDAAEMAGLLRINATGPLLLARAFASLLAAGRDPALLIAVPWIGSLTGKVRGGDYAECAAAAARNMVARTLGHDLAAHGIAVRIGNPGNFKTELEGPAFQHRVDQAATGLLDLVATVSVGAADGNEWHDWNGAVRAW